MAITCPHCGGAELHTKEFRHKQILSVGHYLFGIITGFIGILIWYFSLESTFQCDRCNQRFFARTPVSQIFRVIFHIVIAALLIAAGIAIYLLLFSR